MAELDGMRVATLEARMARALADYMGELSAVGKR